MDSWDYSTAGGQHPVAVSQASCLHSLLAFPHRLGTALLPSSLETSQQKITTKFLFNLAKPGRKKFSFPMVPLPR